MAAAPPAEVTARRGGMILPEGGRERGRGQSRGEAPPPPREGVTGEPLSHRRLRAQPSGRPGAKGSAGADQQPCPTGDAGCAAFQRSGGAARRMRPVWDHLLRGLAGAALPRHAGFGTGAPSTAPGAHRPGAR